MEIPVSQITTSQYSNDQASSGCYLCFFRKLKRNSQQPLFTNDNGAVKAVDTFLAVGQQITKQNINKIAIMHNAKYCYIVQALISVQALVFDLAQLTCLKKFDCRNAILGSSAILLGTSYS